MPITPQEEEWYLIETPEYSESGFVIAQYTIFRTFMEQTDCKEIDGAYIGKIVKHLKLDC